MPATTPDQSFCDGLGTSENTPVGTSGVPDYCGETLERFRDPRFSDDRIYLWVREIFALAADWQSSSKETTRFLQTLICAKRERRPGF
ncbi:RhuM family protein [Serratia sp. L9]|uniref:RhuM family protein n=1 Tax=Serratia sp. L9 TaxID=3423946 RepID=UPI003D670FF8